MLRNFWLLIFISIWTFSTVFGQSDISSYKNLKTFKSYIVSLEKTGEFPFAKYKVNGKWSSKETYEKYHTNFEAIKNCKPCILQSYTTDEILVKESVAYGDCNVGWYKEYFPNGQLKISGQFLENDSDNWEDLYHKGYCNKMDGKWIFYNKNGTPKYIEIWEKGNFVKQIPEQKTGEIWNVEAFLENQKLTFLDTIPFQNISSFSLRPLFKNKNKKVAFQIQLLLTIDHHIIKKSKYSWQQFQQLNLKRILQQSTTSINKITALELRFYQADKYLNFTRFNIN